MISVLTNSQSFSAQPVKFGAGSAGRRRHAASGRKPIVIADNDGDGEDDEDDEDEDDDDDDAGQWLSAGTHRPCRARSNRDSECRAIRRQAPEGPRGKGAVVSVRRIVNGDGLGTDCRHNTSHVGK